MSFGIQQLEQVLLLFRAQQNVERLQATQELIESNVDRRISVETGLFLTKDLQQAFSVNSQATANLFEYWESPVLHVIDSLHAVCGGNGVCELEVADLAIFVGVEDLVQVAHVGRSELVTTLHFLDVHQ